MSHITDFDKKFIALKRRFEHDLLDLLQDNYKRVKTELAANLDITKHHIAQKVDTEPGSKSARSAF